MKVLLYMAVSIDGIAALDSKTGIERYGSEEDKKFFIKASKKCDAVIMGKNTAFYKIKGVPNIILTHSAPASGLAGDGRVCLCGSAQEVYEKAQGMGFKKVALLGGPATNINFLRAGLVDEIFLTVEPVTIGHGIRFLGEPLESRWILAGTKRLNKGGTIVLHYKKIAR